MRLHVFLFTALPCLALHALACGGTTVTGTGAGTTTTTGTGGASASGCPAAQPAQGATCSPAGVTCTYGDSVFPDCRASFTCAEGIWGEAHTACPPANPACPASPPPSQSSCDADAGILQCAFPSDQICTCTSCPPGIGACMVGPPAWYCSGPTGPAGCPALLPNEGTACSGALACTYPSESCGLDASCVAGTWTWMPLACGE